MRSYIVKENYIGSTVSKILRYTQTDIMLILYKDYYLHHYHLETSSILQRKIAINLPRTPQKVQIRNKKKVSEILMK